VSDDQKERNGLRKNVLKARDEIPPAERQHLSILASKNLWQLPDFQSAKRVFLYVNFRSEVETSSLIKRCLMEGKEVAVPLVAPKSQLIPYRITDRAKDLAPGAFGIPEPIVDQCERVNPGSLDLIVLPGSAFDARGGRMGYGGGYYDRFLVNAAPQAKRIGLAFDLQVVASIPLAPHDQLLDVVVTESRVLSDLRMKTDDRIGR